MAKLGNGYQVGLSWIECSNGDVPGHAIDVGGSIYICRCKYSDDVIPGKVVRGHTRAYLAYDGYECPVETYEVLCDTKLERNVCYEWVPSECGEVPSRAIVGGVTSDGEPLYVARTRMKGEFVVGKVHNSHGCAYFPHGGKEHSVQDYDVLTWKK